MNRADRDFTNPSSERERGGDRSREHDERADSPRRGATTWDATEGPRGSVSVSSGGERGPRDSRDERFSGDDTPRGPRGWNTRSGWSSDRENASWPRGSVTLRPRFGESFDAAPDDYRDREGRFGTTYGMEPSHSPGGAGVYRDDGGFHRRFDDPRSWGASSRDEGRYFEHDRYDPRHSQADARRFGGEQRFGQGWERDRFRSQGGPQTRSYEGPGAGRAELEERSGLPLRSFGEDAFGRAPGTGAEHLASHGRGRGPKNYQRSDERIREEICESLARQGRLDASEVEVQVTNGEVLLTGTVARRDDKLAIEHLVDNVYGVLDVRNEIRRTGPAARTSALDKSTTTSSAKSSGKGSNGENGHQSDKSGKTDHGALASRHHQSS
jgi:hypothetical protein